ncbi:MAG: hypothetical protein IJH04_05330, partial [Eggerthellaceae bacterium]|nr:hypothetical protein [Eggerthellaceae bacterium]
MNINAKQMTEIATSRMDITTVLGYFGQIKGIVTGNSALVGALGTVWTTFTAAYDAFDEAYAQTRKWAQTEEIEGLDTTRDQALSAFNAALKSMQSSPNAQKQAGAKLLMNIREKYTLNASDEYMKETTAIAQMIQEMEENMQAEQALTTTGLDDWFQDLKAKNEAFLAKMNERTEAQAGQQKGIVREKRLLAEAAYKNVVKLLNAAAIMEQPADLDYNPVIDRLNAEVEHYRQILARKGTSTGTNSGGDGGSSDGGDDGGSDGGSDGGDTPTPDPTPDPTPTPDPSGGGDDEPGGDDHYHDGVCPPEQANALP